MGRRPKADGTMGEPGLCDPWPSSHYSNPKHIAAVSRPKKPKAPKVSTEDKTLAHDKLVALQVAFGRERAPDLLESCPGETVDDVVKAAIARVGAS